MNRSEHHLCHIQTVFSSCNHHINFNRVSTYIQFNVYISLLDFKEVSQVHIWPYKYSSFPMNTQVINSHWFLVGLPLSWTQILKAGAPVLAREQHGASHLNRKCWRIQPGFISYRWCLSFLTLHVFKVNNWAQFLLYHAC